MASAYLLETEGAHAKSDAEDDEPHVPANKYLYGNEVIQFMSSGADKLDAPDGKPLQGAEKVLCGNLLFDGALPYLGSTPVTRRVVESLLDRSADEVHRLLEDDFLLRDSVNEEADILAENGEIIRWTAWPQAEVRDQTCCLGPSTQMPRVTQPVYSATDRANSAIFKVRDFACFCGSKYVPSM